MKGVIYALANSAMPLLIKIGKTNNLTRRLTQLYSTGVPMPFDCIYAKRVDDVEFVESKLHAAFASNRVNEKREFFTALKPEVISLFDLIPGEDITPDKEPPKDEEADWAADGVSVTLPVGGRILEGESIADLFNQVCEVLKDDENFKYSTIVSRRKKGWTMEQAFGFSVPPNYGEADRLVADGYKYYPTPPTEDGNRIPMISHHERRVYLSQDEFAKEQSIPSDYISDKLKLGWDSLRIIDEYKNYE